MGTTERKNTKPPVEYGPCPWWSADILRTELRNGKTRADLAREWDTTWDTIDYWIDSHGIEEASA